MLIRRIKNPRIENILLAAAEVTKAEQLVSNRQGWYDKASLEFKKREVALDAAKEKLDYALRKLEEATR